MDYRWTLLFFGVINQGDLVEVSLANKVHFQEVHRHSLLASTVLYSLGVKYLLIHQHRVGGFEMLICVTSVCIIKMNFIVPGCGLLHLLVSVHMVWNYNNFTLEIYRT